VRYSGCKFVNVAVPETESEPEFELEFTKKDKTDYRWYLGFEGPEAKAGSVLGDGQRALVLPTQQRPSPQDNRGTVGTAEPDGASRGNPKRKAEPKPRRQKKSLGKKSASRGKAKRTRSSK